MAYFDFTNRLLKGETIQIFNYGNCRRDFTYVDDTTLERDIGFTPKIMLREGLRMCAEWYRVYYSQRVKPTNRNS